MRSQGLACRSLRTRSFSFAAFLVLAIVTVPMNGRAQSRLSDSVTQRLRAMTQGSCEQLGVQAKHWFETQWLSDSATNIAEPLPCYTQELLRNARAWCNMQYESSTHRQTARSKQRLGSALRKRNLKQSLAKGRDKVSGRSCCSLLTRNRSTMKKTSIQASK